jgi:hypothetical protein
MVKSEREEGGFEMNTYPFPFIIVKTTTLLVRKVMSVISNLLINLTYFGWRPSVVYLSGKRRKFTL